MRILSSDIETVTKVNSVTVELDENTANGIMAISWHVAPNTPELMAFYKLGLALELELAGSRLVEGVKIDGRIEGKK